MIGRDYIVIKEILFQVNFSVNYDIQSLMLTCATHGLTDSVTSLLKIAWVEILQGYYN